MLKGAWFYIGSICLIILINSIVYFIFDNSTNAGTFGDVFGLSNALFSGFALAGIIYTILLQQEDLNLQRKELRLTRKEYKTQNDTLALQRFENTFFSLLENHQSILSHMKIETYIVYELIREDNDPNTDHYQEIQLNSLQVFSNKDIFRFCFHKFNYLCADRTNWPLRNAYYKLYNDHQDILGHYFRNIYRIVKMIDNTIYIEGSTEKIAIENFKLRYKYTSILRSQFSVFELSLIFYNCLSDHGSDQFKPLIEKYTLLKNLPSNILYNEQHRMLYNSSAFFKSVVE